MTIADDLKRRNLLELDQLSKIPPRDRRDDSPAAKRISQLQKELSGLKARESRKRAKELLAKGPWVPQHSDDTEVRYYNIATPRPEGSWRGYDHL